jgi:isopenicillin N synthase-like dioxygenase
MQCPATVDLTSCRLASSHSGRGDAVDDASAALCASLRSTGFVVVTGHGLPPDLVDRIHRAFAAFFALPEAVRSRYGGVAGGQRGYTPFGVERAVGHPVADAKEFFHVGADAPGREPANLWPAEIPQLRPLATDLFAALERCAVTLLGLVERGCGLPADTLAGLVRDGNHVLRAAHYPARPPGGDPRVLRAAPHEDINLITLLGAATDAGLEIRDAAGRWTPVEAPPDALVADAGDMLARITNGAIPATTHRVVDPPGGARRARLSLPFFAHPRPECTLRVLERFLEPGAEPSHPPITAAAFLEERLREIGLLAERLSDRYRDAMPDQG